MAVPQLGLQAALLFLGETCDGSRPSNPEASGPLVPPAQPRRKTTARRVEADAARLESCGDGEAVGDGEQSHIEEADTNGPC